MVEDKHQPVLYHEVLHYLITDKNGIYIDGTFGRGGHARGILKALTSQGFLLALDKDPQAIAAASPWVDDKRFCIEQSSFTQIKAFAEKHEVCGHVAGVLLDLGVSSPQLDDPERGFSFLKEGPLDMRMDPSVKIDAATWIAKAKESEIANVLNVYGEERFAKRIARAIILKRQLQPITTTTQLASIIAEANPKWERHKHPATRSFQAIRIFINNELEELTQTLPQLISVLKPKGRLVIISFHSLEDRLVKRFLRENARGKALPAGLPVRHKELPTSLRLVSKAIRPGQEEMAKNPRSRSAILRVAEKC